jgi:hypothetical protein
MGERFPMTMNVCGGIFAVLFIFFRVIIWPLVGLHFWRDGLMQFGYNGAVHVAGLALEIGSTFPSGIAPLHSPAIVGLFLFVNIGLTFLQVIWLKEILDQAAILLSGGEISGSPSTSSHPKQKAV